MRLGGRELGIELGGKLNFKFMFSQSVCLIFHFIVSIAVIVYLLIYSSHVRLG